MLVSGIGGGTGTPTKTAQATKATSSAASRQAAGEAARYGALQAAAQAAAKKGILFDNTGTKKTVTYLPGYGPNGKITAPKTPVKTPVKVPPMGDEGTVSTQPVVEPTAPASATWTLEGDPAYQAAMDAGSAEFNYAKAQSLADLQDTETAKAGELSALNKSSTEARRRLAGNYAARGMAGGATGALTQAEARANAEQIASQTSIKDQLAALNKNFVSTYGAQGTDWTGTLLGQKIKTQAAQSAIQANLARMGL